MKESYNNALMPVHFHARPFIIRVAGYVGAIATTALTVRQYTENYDGWIMLIYSALAFAICIFEFVAIHDSKKYYADKKYFYAFLYLIAGIGAFIFDISGTIGYMSSSVTKAIKEERLSSEVLDGERNLSELRKKQVSGIQGDNQSIRSINDDFILRGKPSKAKENIYAMKFNQGLISSIVKQEENANLKRREIFGSIKTDPLLSFYKSVSNLFNFDVEDVKKWFEVLIATTASLVSILMSGYKSDEEISEEIQLTEIRKKEKELKNKMRMASLNKMIIDFDMPPDGSDPKGKRPSLEKKDDAAPVNEGAKGLSVEPSPSVVSASHNDVAITASSVSEPVRVSLEKPEHSALGLVLAKTTIPNTQENDRVDGSKAASCIRRKRSKGTPDTCVSKGKNLRYKTLCQKVKNGLTPSIRELRKAAGGGDYTTLAKYLAAMAHEGIIERQEDGSYRRAFKPKIVNKGS